jgi:hypothetical protein
MSINRTRLDERTANNGFAVVSTNGLNIALDSKENVSRAMMLGSALCWFRWPSGPKGDKGDKETTGIQGIPGREGRYWRSGPEG